MQEFLFFLRQHPNVRDASGRLLRELHGVTLQSIVELLVERYGWTELAARVPVDCFRIDPTLRSSLVFLRRTAWAREKVEKLYVALRSAEVLGLPQP